MENSENKIIADKVNSIDRLPEGYQPNLEAKWELLQSDRNIKPATYWTIRNFLKIAACLLLMLLSSVFFRQKFSVDEKKHSIVYQTTPASVTDKPDRKVVYVAKHIPKVKSVAREKNIHSNNPQVTGIFPADENISMNEPAADQMAEITPVFTNEAVASETISKKSRFVQIDFDDEVNLLKEQNSFAQGIQFRIGSKDKTSNRKNAGDHPAFRLEHNF